MFVCLSSSLSVCQFICLFINKQCTVKILWQQYNKTTITLDRRLARQQASMCTQAAKRVSCCLYLSTSLSPSLFSPLSSLPLSVSLSFSASLSSAFCISLAWLGATLCMLVCVWVWVCGMSSLWLQLRFRHASFAAPP